MTDRGARRAPHVTVNLVVAIWPLTSVAVTTVPDVALGTLKVQLNEPITLTVKEPALQLEIVTESNTKDVSVVDTENPVPDTVTIAPRGPWIGLTVIAGVTPNGLDALAM